jgi:Circularly permuted ATP-grasp type 2
VDEPWYDEAFGPDGLLRPPYAAMRERTGWHPMRPSARAAGRLRDRPLHDDARILPLPLVLDAREHQRLRAGVAQRARVLQHVFADLVLGDQRALRAGIGLTEGLVEHMLAAECTTRDRLRRLWRRHDLEAIRFVYGPDLVREHTGRWLVLEDNVGCVGGMVDSFEVADRYRRATGLTGCPTCEPDPDLVVATRRILDRAGERGGRVLAVSSCGDGRGNPWAFTLAEDSRKRRLLNRIGIAVLDGAGFARRWARGDVGSPCTLLNSECGGSERSALAQAFADPATVLLNAPGTGVLGNKSLLPYLDELTRFYTGAQPLLATPATHVLTEGGLPATGDGWVVKASTGRQGTEVFVLTGQTRSRREHVASLLRTAWSSSGAVAQRYVEPSRLSPAGPGGWDGYRVEIRLVGYAMGWQDVHVGRQPVGKLVPVFDPWRLNNISQGACYAPVLCEPCCCGSHRTAVDGHGGPPE